MSVHTDARQALRKAVGANITEAVEDDPRDQFEIARLAWPDCEKPEIEDPAERRRKFTRAANRRMQLAKRGSITLDGIASLAAVLGLEPWELLWARE